MKRRFAAAAVILLTGGLTFAATSKPAATSKAAAAAKAAAIPKPVAPPTLEQEQLRAALELLTSEPAEPLELEAPKAGEIDDGEKPLKEIPDSLLDGYFASRPNEFLVDPQKLLPPDEFKARLDFLNYHAGDSTIDFFVYVIPGDQEIPGSARLEELGERLFSSGRPAVIVMYYFGAPERSRLILSPSLNDEIPSAEQGRAMESSVMQAVERADASGQLEKFLTQMSIRVYWMESVVTGQPVVETTAHVATVAAGQVAGKAARKPVKFAWIHELALRFAVPAGFFLAGILAVYAMVFWLRVRSRHRFPDFSVEPRLGGAHAAGIGAVISFASAAVPPASQRDQVPDYLRRA